MAQTAQGLCFDLADAFPLHSRVLLRKVIAAKGVTVDGETTKVAYRLRAGQKVTVALPHGNCSQRAEAIRRVAVDIVNMMEQPW